MVDGSDGHDEQSPGRGAGGVGRRLNFSRHGESSATTVPNPYSVKPTKKVSPGQFSFSKIAWGGVAASCAFILF